MHSFFHQFHFLLASIALFPLPHTHHSGKKEPALSGAQTLSLIRLMSAFSGSAAAALSFLAHSAKIGISGKSLKKRRLQQPKKRKNQKEEQKAKDLSGLREQQPDH